MAFKATGRAFTRCVRVPGRTKPPVWTAKAVGRVACYALQSGATVEELLAELDRCAPCKEKRSRRQQKRLELALQQNNGVLRDAELVLTTLDLALEGFLLLSRFVPMLRVPALLVIRAKKPVAAIVRRIQTQRASNDELYDQIIREVTREAA